VLSAGHSHVLKFMKQKYRIVHDTYLNKFFIQKKFLGIMWSKWCGSLNEEHWSGSHRSYWGFSSCEEAKAHLIRFLAEEEIRRQDRLKEKASDRTKVVEQLFY